MDGPMNRKYGEATTIPFVLYDVTGAAMKTDAAAATGDIKIMKDEGAEANLAADTFTDEGQGYSLALTAAEMTASRIMIYIVDQGTKVWLDKILLIETYGDGSSQHPNDGLKKNCGGRTGVNS